jgi:uncharacterized protein (DUF2147 family)
MKRACLFLASVALQMTTGPVFADSVFGTWLRDNGKYQVRFEPCGDAVCGDIVWLKPGGDTEAKIGQRIFFDMKPDGANSWVGKAKKPGRRHDLLGQILDDGKFVNN